MVFIRVCLFSFIVVITRKPYRLVIFPSVGMLFVGSFTFAITSPFYYIFGSWGLGYTAEISSVEIQEFIYDILFSSQYITFLSFLDLYSQ